MSPRGEIAHPRAPNKSPDGCAVNPRLRELPRNHRDDRHEDFDPIGTTIRNSRLAPRPFEALRGLHLETPGRMHIECLRGGKQTPRETSAQGLRSTQFVELAHEHRKTTLSPTYRRHPLARRRRRASRCVSEKQP